MSDVSAAQFNKWRLWPIQRVSILQVRHAIHSFITSVSLSVHSLTCGQGTLITHERAMMDPNISTAQDMKIIPHKIAVLHSQCVSMCVYAAVIHRWLWLQKTTIPHTVSLLMAATTLIHYYQRSVSRMLVGEKLSLKSANKCESRENVRDIWETKASTRIKQQLWMCEIISNFMQIRRMWRINAQFEMPHAVLPRKSNN